MTRSNEKTSAGCRQNEMFMKQHTAGSSRIGTRPLIG
jgi:hypothetical protein